MDCHAIYGKVFIKNIFEYVMELSAQNRDRSFGSFYFLFKRLCHKCWMQIDNRNSQLLHLFQKSISQNHHPTRKNNEIRLYIFNMCDKCFVVSFSSYFI